MSNLLDVLAAPWAITRPAFDQAQATVRRHLAGEAADLAAIEAAQGKPLANQRTPLSVDGGVAVICLEGVLTKRVNMLANISGGTSTQIAIDELARAAADPSVHSIVLAIDSPGGSVDGTQALADAVYAVRHQKPIVAVADGTMASAAYWIGSAADEVYISGDTTAVGSIGVIATHNDYSGADAARGVKTTEIVAGKFKNATSSHAPLTAAGREVIQAQVDALYQVFLADVARNRGTTSTLAHERMGDGRVFLGQDAIKAGLVDGVKTLSAVVSIQQTAAARAARETLTAAAARPAPQSPGDLHRAALRRVADMRALGVHLNFAAALAAVSSEQ